MTRTSNRVLLSTSPDADVFHEGPHVEHELIIHPASRAHLKALAASPAELRRILGVRIPAGWPHFPEAVPFTLTRLRDHPEEADWWMHLFRGGDDRVGSGGFGGPPQGGVVEIGCEIAPEYRGHGHATAEARA